MTEKNNYDGRLQMHSADDAILQSIVEARNFRSSGIKPASIAAKMAEFSKEIGGRVGLLMVGVSGSSLLWHDDPGIITEIMRAVGQGQHVSGLFGFPSDGEIRFKSLERNPKLPELSEEFGRTVIEGARSEYDVMNDFLEFDVAVWVTLSQEDREIITPVLRKYLPPEMADYYTSRNRWTTGQVEMVIEKLTSGRKSNAKAKAIRLASKTS
jgi:hypothetical protein